MNDIRTESLVSICDLTKKYGRSEALSHLTLEIPRGRIIGLLGPNGCGKSTLIKLICGLLVPSGGEVFIQGKKPGPETKAIISYLPERSYVQGSVRIRELLSLFADLYADFEEDKARAMLSSLQIDPSAPFKTLSKGTKEKVQLIMVMSRKASLYILDEPIAGVDPAARDFILKTIIQGYREEASILLSTHLIADIETILDDVIFLKEGKLLLSSSVEDIRNNYAKSVDGYFREVFSCS